eukprot:10989249-Ditylum_brightwellii.AAC.1
MKEGDKGGGAPPPPPFVPTIPETTQEKLSTSSAFERPNQDAATSHVVTNRTSPTTPPTAAVATGETSALHRANHSMIHPQSSRIGFAIAFVSGSTSVFSGTFILNITKVTVTHLHIFKILALMQH